jgi:hypothetical protein
MANFAKVSFSNANLDLTDITQHHADVESSLRDYFKLNPRFIGEPPEKVDQLLNECLIEHEQSTVLNLLASLEAALRIDYLQRCYRKMKDPLSREFRQLHAKKGPRASLADEILPAWKDCTSVPPQIISDLKGAFRYRHWLAHGRYWVPKLGQKYDYVGVSILAASIYNSFRLERIAS